MIRRGVMLLIGSGLLGLLTGCYCQGRCDCLTYPIGYGTPRPYATSAPPIAPPVQPIAPVPVH